MKKSETLSEEIEAKKYRHLIYKRYRPEFIDYLKENLKLT